MASINKVIRKVIQGFNKDEFTNDKAFNYALSTVIPATVMSQAGRKPSMKNFIEDLKSDFKLYYNYYDNGTLPEDPIERRRIISKIQRIAQNAHLLPPSEQDEYFKERGYIKNPNSKVKQVYSKELNGRLKGKDISIYSANPDVIDRGQLRVVGNLHGLHRTMSSIPDFMIEGEYPADMGRYSAAIYTDKNGKLYANMFDLNDYGKYGLMKSIVKVAKDRKMKKFKYIGDDLSHETGAEYDNLQPLAELADILGTPTIVESGVFPLSYEDAIYYANKGKKYHKNNKKLSKILNIYANSAPNDYIYDANYLMRDDPIMEKAILITPNNTSNISKKKFGGKLRYGWGGMTPWDTAASLGFTLNDPNDPNREYNEAKATYDYYYAQAQAYAEYFGAMGGSSNPMDYMPSDLLDGSYENVNSFVDTHGFGEKALYGDINRAMSDDPQLWSKTRIRDISIYNNMQKRIANDVEIYRSNTNKTNNVQIPKGAVLSQISKYGGLIPHKRFNYGGINTAAYTQPYSGNVGWGMQVKPEDISYSEYNADGEGIQGSEMTNKAMMLGSAGASLGAMSGLAAGTALGAWGGPIGMAAGLIGGLIWGAISGNKKKKEEEARRRKLLAEQKEANRQNTLGNMQNRIENDVAATRTQQPTTSFINNSFYSKYGGLIPMRKYNYGGIIPTEGGVMIPTSDDTMVAKGATHEQGGIMLDPQSEVENNEVIRATPTGDQIFSDSLYVPGTRVTYAKYANKLSRQKGKIENDIKSIKSTLSEALDEYPKLKQTHAQDGTSRRNMEKLAAKLNIKTGQLAQLEQKLSNTFMNQEEQAYALGLRDTEPVMAKYGGNIKKHAFGVADMNLITNGLGFIGNILGNELTYNSNKAQLDFMKKLKVPKQARLETQYHKIDTTPYEQARRKMTAETRRFNKWIENEVSNPQVLRNQKRKALIGYYEGLGDIAAKESDYRTSVYDKNYNARVTTNNMNRQIDYQDLLAEYNRDMDYYNALIGLSNQAQNGRMAAINQMMQATNGYLNQRMYIASLPKGVQKEFYWGNNINNELGLTNQDIRSLRRAGVDIRTMRNAWNTLNQSDLESVRFILGV